VHPYSTDSAWQRVIMLLMAVLAILLAWLLARGFELSDSTPPWWLDTPAVVGFYTMLWKLYDRLLWRSGLAGWTISGVPDFRGAWSGNVESSFRPGEPYPAKLVIRQTSSRILIELTTGRSRSYSRLAMIHAAPGRDRGLHYVYENEPKPLQEEIKRHGGSATLWQSTDGQTLTGYYITDSNRRTRGEMNFTRTEDPA
jgi:hypothetical protein